jgi:hypothetical protein
MRPYRTDYRLWGVFTVAALGGVALVELRGGPGCLVATVEWAQKGFDKFGRIAPALVPLLLGEFLMAAAVAWSAHALLVLCGVRLSADRRSRAPDQAADYDDAPSARPG